MTNRGWSYADAHRLASEGFRELTPEQQRERMRAAGVLGVTPQLGDKVRVLGRLDEWRYGVVVGADQHGHGRVHVAHENAGRVVEPLETFANGQRVDLVQRAPSGRERDVAAMVMGKVGQPFDFASLDADAASRELRPPAQAQGSSAGALLGGLLAAAGLAALAIAFSEDREWDERAGRYRDARGRFSSG